jgi:FkbM family methyltransferase
MNEYKTPVIVMALYDIGRADWDRFNLSYNTYLYWMKNTLSIDANFVIYTEEKFKETIEKYRQEFDENFEKTKIVVQPLEDLDYYKNYNLKLSELMFSDNFKRKIHLQVPEATKPLYNVIMFNKLSFLKDAKDNNYFDGDYFIWADAGGLRNGISEYQGQIWPDLNKLSKHGDKIVFFSHSKDFKVDDKEYHSLSQIRHIQGTCFFVPKNRIDKFYLDFRETVDECLSEGYIGSDEKVLDITYLKEKEIYSLVQCTWREYFNIFKKGENYKKNVFIDLGSHNCQGLDYFINHLKINQDWEIHTFEPNPLVDNSICVNKYNTLDITTHKDAVWIKDGFLTFKQYGDDGTGQGSLLEDTKGDEGYHDYYSSCEVKVIDFLNFLKKFKNDQDIYIKMDIEWSEFAILDDMLSRGWPTNIKHIWIDWHGKNKEYLVDKSKFLIQKIKEKKCQVNDYVK